MDKEVIVDAMGNEVIVKEWKRFRRYPSGAEYYDISQRQFEKMARDAKAVIKIGGLAYVDCNIFEEYLLSFRIN